MTARLFPDRPLSEATAQAEEVVRRAVEKHNPNAIFVLFSGGNDSMVLLSATRHLATAVVHINTGIGIPETTEFARSRVELSGLPLLEYRPPVPYESLVLDRNVFAGFPGPGFHGPSYQRLKERCVRKLVADHKRRRSRETVMLLSGVRKAESRRRMGYSNPVDVVDGAQVWVNPLLDWTNDEMRQHRELYELPENPVSANLHMSGECLCGAMANEDHGREELAMIRFFYPDFGRRIDELEAEVAKRNLPFRHWGMSRPRSCVPVGPLCQGCEGRQGKLL